MSTHKKPSVNPLTNHVSRHHILKGSIVAFLKPMFHSVFVVLFLGMNLLRCTGVPIYQVPDKDLSGFFKQETYTPLEPNQFKDFFAIQNPDYLGLHTESANTLWFTWIGSLMKDDTLYYTDLLGETDPISYRTKQKLALSWFGMASDQGKISEVGIFTAYPDPLLALDTGYQLRLTCKPLEKTKTYTLKPLYSTSLFVPYLRNGYTPPQSKAGLSYYDATRNIIYDGNSGLIGVLGRNGLDGKTPSEPATHGGRGENGRDGNDGSDGSNGSGNGGGGSGGSGSDGGNGGNGGDGTDGMDGLRGEDGLRGDDGPNLTVIFEPIYSKFYPFETLIYTFITATYVTGVAETHAYIFHAQQPYTITTRGGNGGQGGNGGRGGNGGDGGSGGDGGRGGEGGDGGDGGDGGGSGNKGSGGDGGDGGDGGNGGDGGEGAMPGRGGDGGDGGNGGNGGIITVVIHGDAAFRSWIIDYFLFSSLGGNGGQGGFSGENGSVGSAGSSGSQGRAGDGGDGGEGNPKGNDGSDGSSGNRGSTGNTGPYHPSVGASGRVGKDGVVQSVVIERP